MHNDDMVIVYMDQRDRCRTVVNPTDLTKFLGKENVAINPPIAEALARGITPDMWYIEDSQLKFRARKLDVDVSKLDLYEMFIEISDIKDEMNTWIAEKKAEVEKQSKRIMIADRKLRRLYRFVLSLRISIVLTLVLCILFTSVVIGVSVVY